MNRNALSAKNGLVPPGKLSRGGEELDINFTRKKSASPMFPAPSSVLRKQEQTFFNDLRQGTAILNPTGRLEYKVVVSHHDFRMGCDPQFCNRVVQIIKVYSMIIHNNNMNQDHYLTCPLTPQVKTQACMCTYTTQDSTLLASIFLFMPIK